MQGQYEDEETGLYYNRYRYFDPNICTYVSQDPIRLNAGMNLYHYGPNNIKYIDPLGLMIVYRALNSMQESDFLSNSSIKPKDVNAINSVQEHIDNGRLNTQYISTTKDLNTAKFYAKSNNSTIIEIDTSKLNPNNIIDVSNGIDPTTGEKLKNPAFKYSTKDKEVLVKGEISEEAYKKKGC